VTYKEAQRCEPPSIFSLFHIIGNTSQVRLLF
jgi:hypothetical protein